MYSLMVITCIAAFIIIILLLLKVNKKSQYIQWGLGVDCICFYSSPFTVSKQGIVLIGCQKVLGGNSPILYSVVKQNWWGKTKVYGQVVIYGDYNSPNYFNVEITNIPYGENYRIKVVNRCNISRGKFKIIAE